MENELKINEDMTLSDDELIHWGVRGMRWGIRRYQNKDGSLTPRGQKRYNEELKKVRAEEKVLKTRQATKAKLDRLEARKKAAADKKKELDDEEAAAKGKRKKDSDDKSGKAGKRSVKDMDDIELATALNRARMEDAYLQLRPEQVAKSGAMRDFMNSAVKPAAINAGKSFVESGLKKLAEKALGDKVDPDSIEAIKKTFEKMDYKQRIDKIMNPDKYKSAEERLKEFDLEVKKADRDARSRGYKDAFTETNARLSAEKAAAKRASDEAARAANEAKSREYYDSTYRHKGVGREDAGRGSGSSSSNPIRKLLGGGTSTTEIVTTRNVSNGRDRVSGLLDDGIGRRSTNEIGYMDSDGDFHFYDD